MLVDHELDIAEDLAVPAVCLLAGLDEAVGGLFIKDAVGLGVEDEGDGEQALDPFCLPC